MKSRLLPPCILSIALITSCQPNSVDQAIGQTTVEEMPSMISASGELASMDSEFMAPPRVKNTWRFTISFLAEDGKVAQPGQPIVIFDSQSLKNKLIEKQAKLDQKRSEYQRQIVNNREKLDQLTIRHKELIANLNKAKRKAELPQDILARNTFQENQLLNQLAQLELTKSEQEQTKQKQALETDEKILVSDIKRLEIEVSELKASIKKMTLSATRAGVVIHKTDWSGNKYSVGDTVWGRRIAEVASLSTMIAKLEIEERNIRKVQEGQRIRFSLDANPEQKYYGTISALAKVVRTKSATQPAMVIDAIAQVETPDLELMRPGMRINAEIIQYEQPELADL